MDGMGTFFTGLRIVGTVSEWSQKALADGKVTLVEAVELAERVGSILGVRLELTIPTVPEGPLTDPPETVEELSETSKRSWE